MTLICAIRNRETKHCKGSHDFYAQYFAPRTVLDIFCRCIILPVCLSQKH
jgi:hypothetical protein